MSMSYLELVLIFAIFQDKILSGLPAAHIVDDVLITGKNDSEHLEKLRSVLDELRDFGIHLNPDKCEFLLIK